MGIRQLTAVFFGAGVMISTGYGQGYPFSDDFSNPLQTSSNWGKWIATDGLLSATCSGGVYTITNQHTDATPGLIYHNFTNKTDTFTASCTVTRSSTTINAGMWLNLPSYPTFSGYAVMLGGDDCIGSLDVTKYVSGNPTDIFHAYYQQQNPSNAIKFSEQGNTFTVFCNDVFLGSFTDNSPVAPGNFALLVPPNSTTDFDNASFTNQFTPGSFPTLFIDNFNNSRIENAWILSECSYFSENDSVLDITATGGTGIALYCGTPMTIDTFYSCLIASHRHGDSMPYYGFYLRGPDTMIGPSTYSHALALFGISGFHACNNFVIPAGGVGTYTPKYYTANIVHGKAFVSGQDSTFFKDTIVVKKTTVSNYYLMYVNNNKLDSLSTTDITFPLTGAGIFCDRGNGQEIFVDYFFLGPDSSTTAVINIARNTRLVKSLRFSPMTSKYLFNPLGRIVGRRDASGRLTDKALAPGFYITDEKKSGIIINKLEK